jgi:hypothetical protein
MIRIGSKQPMKLLTRNVNLAVIAYFQIYNSQSVCCDQPMVCNSNVVRVDNHIARVRDAALGNPHSPLRRPLPASYQTLLP